MRVLLIGVVFCVGLVAATSVAEAGRGGIVVINTGDDLVHVRDLTADQAAIAIGYSKLGYHYERFGVFWFDLWRWDGEFVLYQGDTYVPLDDEQVAALGGASVPWRYHLPPGLLLLVAAIELAVITRTRRRLKTTLAIGGVLVAIGVVFYAKGLDWEFLIPLLLGLHHLLGSYFEVKRQRDQEAEAAVAASEPIDPSRAASEPISPSRAASEPINPIVVERPTTAPAVAIKPDERVEGPKLLR